MEAAVQLHLTPPRQGAPSSSFLHAFLPQKLQQRGDVLLLVSSCLYRELAQQEEVQMRAGFVQALPHVHRDKVLDPKGSRGLEHIEEQLVIAVQLAVGIHRGVGWVACLIGRWIDCWSDLLQLIGRLPSFTCIMGSQCSEGSSRGAGATLSSCLRV